MHDERLIILEEELLLIRHSGEIPEVALHASLHYLCSDPEGPGMIVDDEERRMLEQAAAQRYEEIILRDLNPANRDLSIFRGVQRAIHNWRRYLRFSDSASFDTTGFRRQARQSLLVYLAQEKRELQQQGKAPGLNCSAQDLLAFAQALGLHQKNLPPEWEQLCG